MASLTLWYDANVDFFDRVDVGILALSTTHTTPMSKQLNKPVGELRLGADDDASTLTTQENPPKKLVNITNMPECTLETSENV